jgi:hypothetical protein
MSLKWRRSQQWDREHFPSWAWPARAVLHAFSSIPLAVVLLSSVVVYATLASVPIGLLAEAPTYVVYGVTLVATVGLLAWAPVAAARRVLRGRVRPGVLFAGTVLGGLVLAAAAAEAWHAYLWPALHYDPATGSGVRLFAGFCERYRATTLRRLPGMEMSELEFYGWWPLRVILLAFVLNMVTATVRRIEFTFVNLGVLTVHTGIVTIALGSMYYHRLKLEGDTLLLAGEPASDGTPTPGPPQNLFYDNTRVSLWVFRGHQWEERPLSGVPRYNDYNLGAGCGGSVLSLIGRGPDTSSDGGRLLDVAVGPPRSGGGDPDVRFRVVGYASYADSVDDWVPGVPGSGARANPLRLLTLVSSLPDEAGQSRSGPVAKIFLLPDRPSGRVSENEAFGIEWTRGMSERRWSELSCPLPEGTRHALVVEVPGADGGAGYRAAYPVDAGAEVAVGSTGWRVKVKELHEQPPFPIITEGYQGARSSVAVVRVTGPDGRGFDRWLYHRFPEISQDMLDERNERGMPRRRDADPAIRISYLDVSKLQVYLDEREDGSVRAIVRQPRGLARTEDGMRSGDTIRDLVPMIGLELGEFWPHAELVSRPRVVPENRREKEDVGTHGRAMLAVEVGVGEWSKVVWLPFTRYLGVMDRSDPSERTVRMPDGRMLMLTFGRRVHQLPGFMVQLVDFTMQAYDHRGSPRDYQSMIRVIPTGVGFEAFEHVTKLNAPLQAPFTWSEGRSWLSNAWGTLRSRLSPAQFKFSQAGWDKSGWEQSQAAADRGELSRPFARFTILGVGNNPGIHVIAAGGVMMSVGIPWAFYVKPWILRRRKRALQSLVSGGRAGEPRDVAGVGLNGEAGARRGVGAEA